MIFFYQMTSKSATRWGLNTNQLYIYNVYIYIMYIYIMYIYIMYIYIMYIYIMYIYISINTFRTNSDFGWVHASLEA